jgi:hypothetical protein
MAQPCGNENRGDIFIHEPLFADDEGSFRLVTIFPGSGEGDLRLSKSGKLAGCMRTYKRRKLTADASKYHC